MLKRPINPRFEAAVLEDRKITTIRKVPWKLGVEIMLYHWQGAAYRSKHVDVCAVVVHDVLPITITHGASGVIQFNWLTGGDPRLASLWECEGFESPEAMQLWFRDVVPVGKSERRYLMRFERVEQNRNRLKPGLQNEDL